MYLPVQPSLKYTSDLILCCFLLALFLLVIRAKSLAALARAKVAFNFVVRAPGGLTVKSTPEHRLKQNESVSGQSEAVSRQSESVSGQSESVSRQSESVSDSEAVKQMNTHLS